MYNNVKLLNSRGDGYRLIVSLKKVNTTKLFVRTLELQSEHGINGHRPFNLLWFPLIRQLQLQLQHLLHSQSHSPTA